MAKTIIAYDLGTGGNKASLYDVDGNCLGAVFVPYETTYPQAGWHEQRPMDWWNAVVERTRKLLVPGTIDPATIRSLRSCGTATTSPRCSGRPVATSRRSARC